jgi:hypothetical protein
MMIGIAILAVPLGIGVELKSRSDRYRRLAVEHAQRADHPELDPDFGPEPSTFRRVAVSNGADPTSSLFLNPSKPSHFETVARREHAEVHRSLAAAYSYAASHPWVTVPPQQYWAWSPTEGWVVREMR